MVSVNDVTFSYGYEPVLERVTFAVPRGKKVGIVGPNGAGKSTLFKILTGDEMPSTGRVSVSGVLAFVPQEVKHDPALHTAKDWREYVDPTGKAGQHAIVQVLDGLEFDWTKASQDLSQLSGGQKTKLALARAFLAKPDVLLLDEPTNFLDEAGKKWVMHFLGTYPKTVLVVSHDLKLLDRHISQVLFVNAHTHTVDVYTGNYTKFMKTKGLQEAHLVRQIRNEKQHISRIEKSVERLKKNTSDKGVRQRVVLQRRLQRMKDRLPSAPPELRGIKVAFPAPLPVGAVPLEARHIYKSYGRTPVLQDVSIVLERGERLALIGPNGVGKTTLIKILTGNLQPDSGAVERSESLNYGYYSQEFQMFDDTQTLEQVIRDTNKLPPHRVYPFLGRFLFPYSRLNQRINTLSGGEKTRLSIALLMLQQHNLLILDEPTTYLDVLSQRIILEALKDYTGAMILVSHTQEFVSELQPHRALLLPQNKTFFWSDDLSERVTEI